MKSYNFKDFAALLNITPQTLRVWVKQGKVSPPYRHPSGRPFFLELHYQEYLEKASKNAWRGE